MADGGNGGRNGEDHLTVAIDQLEGSWRGLTDALTGIPEERLGEAGAVGEWSVKDLMGHVAFWDDEALAAAERHLAGEPPLATRDWQAINEREAAARTGRAAGEQRAEMERAHEAIIGLLRSRPPLDPEAVGLCGCGEDTTVQHYDEHAAEIRAWRERVGI